MHKLDQAKLKLHVIIFKAEETRCVSQKLAREGVLSKLVHFCRLL